MRHKIQSIIPLAVPKTNWTRGRDYCLVRTFSTIPKCNSTSPHILSDCLAVSIVFLMPGNLERVKNEHYTSTTRALRTVYFGNKSTYEELLQRAKLPTLHTWRLQAIAVVMYKVKNGLVPSYIADLFVVTNSQYHLRNSYFTIQRFRNVACGKRSLTFLTNLFHRLNHCTLLKSAPNWFISQACLDSTCQDCLSRNS